MVDLEFSVSLAVFLIEDLNEGLCVPTRHFLASLHVFLIGVFLVSLHSGIFALYFRLDRPAAIPVAIVLDADLSPGDGHGLGLFDLGFY